MHPFKTYIYHSTKLKTILNQSLAFQHYIRPYTVYGRFHSNLNAVWSISGTANEYRSMEITEPLFNSSTAHVRFVCMWNERFSNCDQIEIQSPICSRASGFSRSLHFQRWHGRDCLQMEKKYFFFIRIFRWYFMTA